MDLDEARRIAEVELSRWNDALTPNRLKSRRATSHDPGDEVVVTDVKEHQQAWIVQFASRRWLETRSTSDMLIGTCPLVIDRATGDLHVYGSGEHDKFQAWLDA